jgi:hypothetical protein
MHYGVRGVLQSVSVLVGASGLALLLGCGSNAPTDRPTTAAAEHPVSGDPSGMPPQVAFVMSCNIERLNDVAPEGQSFPIAHGDRLRVSGWVVDETVHKSPTRVFVVLQSVSDQRRWSAPITGRVAREDVAKARGSDANAGFQTTIDTVTLPAGEYLVLVISWSDGSTQICDVGRRIIVR